MVVGKIRLFSCQRFPAKAFTNSCHPSRWHRCSIRSGTASNAVVLAIQPTSTRNPDENWNSLWYPAGSEFAGRSESHLLEINPTHCSGLFSSPKVADVPKTNLMVAEPVEALHENTAKADNAPSAMLYFVLLFGFRESGSLIQHLRKCSIMFCRDRFAPIGKAKPYHISFTFSDLELLVQFGRQPLLSGKGQIDISSPCDQKRVNLSFSWVVLDTT